MITFTLMSQNPKISFLLEDIDYLNQNDYEITFEEIKCNTLIPEDIIIVLIDITRNIEMSALYDMLKYSLSRLFDMFQKKLFPKKDEVMIRMKNNGKTFECYLSFDLTYEQKNKIIDSAIDEIKKW